MLAIGIWLLVVGVCDLLRAARDATTARRRAAISALGVAAMILLVIPAGMAGSEWAGLGLGMTAGFVLWVLGSSSALQRGRTLTRAFAFIGFALGLGSAVVGGGLLDSPGWPSSLDGSALTHWPVDRTVLVAGVLLVQLSTANVMVRLLLDAVGVPATTNEKTLRGGRVLGPMERLFLVGLGLAGAVTAAAVVVAAKGLLRFPELQQGERRPGPSDVTEYFLIGSFASWLVALGGLGLVWFGTAPH